MARSGVSATEYQEKEKRMVWTIRKVSGGSEMSLRMKITLDQPITPAHRREMGPISMQFEIPMYNVSNLQVWKQKKRLPSPYLNLCTTRAVTRALTHPNPPQSHFSIPYF